MHSAAVKAHIASAARRLLDHDLDRLIDRSTQLLFTEDSTYRPVGAQSLTEQMLKNITLTLVRISGDPIPKELASAAYDTGQLRAAQRIDLPSVSRSFRIDLRVLWEAFLADAREHGLADNSDYIAGLLRVWEAVEANINEMTEGYRAAAAQLAQQDNEVKAAAFQRLLSTGESGGFAAVAGQLELLGFETSAPLFCAVSDLSETGDPEIPIIQARLAQHGIAHYFGWQNRHLVGILQSPEHELERLVPLLDELRTSRTCLARVPRTTALIDAIRNARILVVGGGSVGIKLLHEHWLEAIARAEPTLIDALVDDLFAPFGELSDYVREELTRVIAGFFATNGTIAEIAEATFRHRNTVRNRLAQVEQLTGLKLSVPRDAALLALAFPHWNLATR